MRPLACPGCAARGPMYLRKVHVALADANIEVCNYCGLPIALWPRWKAAMELAGAVIEELASGAKTTRGRQVTEVRLDTAAATRLGTLAGQAVVKALGRARRKA